MPFMETETESKATDVVIFTTALFIKVTLMRHV